MEIVKTMKKIETIEYRSEDGALFKTRYHCVIHEKKQQLKKLLTAIKQITVKDTVWWCVTSAEELRAVRDYYFYDTPASAVAESGNMNFPTWVSVQKTTYDRYALITVEDLRAEIKEQEQTIQQLVGVPVKDGDKNDTE